MLKLPIEEFSAKVRTGPPIDDEDDYSFPTWAGVLPLSMGARTPVPDPRLDANHTLPGYLRDWTRPRLQRLSADSDMPSSPSVPS